MFVSNYVVEFCVVVVLYDEFVLQCSAFVALLHSLFVLFCCYYTLLMGDFLGRFCYSFICDGDLHCSALGVVRLLFW